MPEPLHFQRRQHAFAACIRDPDGTPVPDGIEPRRMNIYARLVYNNIEAFLARTFSAFRGLVDDEAWHTAVRAFVREHRAQSPYFSHIPAEFLTFIKDAAARAGLPPFALELCHYEWTKLALDLAPDAPCRFDDDPIAATEVVALSPMARLLEYAFPVHAIDTARRTETLAEKPTLLVVWRDRHDQVRAMRVNRTTMRLLQSIRQGRPADACLEEVAAALPAGPAKRAEQVRQAGLSMLDRLHRQDIVLRPAGACREGAPPASGAARDPPGPLVSEHSDE